MLTVTPGVSQTCKHINLAQHRVLYLCSPSFESAASLTLLGRGDTLRQVVIRNAAVGEIVIDSIPSTTPVAVFSAFTFLKHLEFTLRDGDDNIVDFADHHISFVIEITRP
jgi:hypothetical protein